MFRPLFSIGGVFLILLICVAIVWLVAYLSYRRHMVEAETVWLKIADRANSAVQTYDPAMVANLPEIAQRYFNHAIAPGTPLSTTVELRMEGRFHLGDKDKFQTFRMRARQILTAPKEFVWRADMNFGPMMISGSDGFYGGHGWTRFWLFGSVPLVQGAGSPDLDRSAAARPALETVWVPAALLPQNGARWEHVTEDKVKVILDAAGTRTEVFLTLAETGRVMEVVTQRWSDANREKIFQLQFFGGTMDDETRFGGFTIPSLVRVGNHYGTEDYFTFFDGRIVAATYR